VWYLEGRDEGRDLARHKFGKAVHIEDVGLADLARVHFGGVHHSNPPLPSRKAVFVGKCVAPKDVEEDSFSGAFLLSFICWLRKWVYLRKITEKLKHEEEAQRRGRHH
jgi:hypothetical protein